MLQFLSQGNSLSTFNAVEDIGVNGTVTLDNENRGNFDDKFNDNITIGIEEDAHIETDVDISLKLDPGIEFDLDDDEEGDNDSDGEVVDYGIIEPEDQLPIEQGEKYIQAVTDTCDICTDPKILSYIDNNEYQHILFGPQENEIKPCIQTTTLPRLNAKEKRVFRFVNIVFQTPSCVRLARITWTSQKVRSVYERNISDFLLFVIKDKINGKDVDESNLNVDGYAVRKFMQAKIQRHLNSNRNDLGLFDTLRKVRNALVALQGQIALYKATQVKGHKEMQQVFLQNATVTNMNIVEQFLNERKKEHDELRKNILDSKAVNTGQFGTYLRKQAIQMLSNVWNKTGLCTAQNDTTHMNSFLELLLDHHLFLREDNKRSLEISDARLTIEKTSRGDIPVLSFQLTDSKSTTYGGKARRSMGVCRSKHVELCLISAFAFSLWYRFDFENGLLHGEKFPNFMSKANWYPIKVLFPTREKDRKEIWETQERKLFSNFVGRIGLYASRVTHFLRRSDAQNESGFDISEEQIAREGDCANSSHVKQYLSSHPFEYIHSSAGFQPDEPYYIARDIDVPVELQKLVFPWLEYWIHKVDSRTDQIGKDEKERDRQLSHFLRMLLVFRSIIIQDLAVRMRKSSSSVFAKHKVTRHFAFTEFLKKMNWHMENENEFSKYPDPNLPDYYKVVDRFSSPLSKSLNTFQTSMEYDLKKINRELLQIKAIVSPLADMRSEINDKIDNLKTESAGLKTQIARLTTQIARLTTQIAELQDLLKTQITTISQLLTSWGVRS